MRNEVARAPDEKREDRPAWLCRLSAFCAKKMLDLLGLVAEVSSGVGIVSGSMYLGFSATQRSTCF